MLRLTLAAALMCGAAGAASAEAIGPSFLCSEAANEAEKRICASPELAKADVDIKTAFVALFVKLGRPGIDALARDQQMFIATRDDIAVAIANGDNFNTLEDTLRERLRFLKSIDARPAEGLVGTWENSYGTIEVKSQTGEELTVEANSAEPQTGRWVCGAEGTGKAVGDALEVKVDDEGSVLKLSRTGPVLGVDASGGPEMVSYCGLNGTVEGSYFKILPAK